jgi:hypothetical protein
MDDLLQVHKKSEALLQGEKNLTEMIARGDALEAILEGSCKLVEEALPGALAIILCWTASGSGAAQRRVFPNTLRK